MRETAPNRELGDFEAQVLAVVQSALAIRNSPFTNGVVVHPKEHYSFYAAEYGMLHYDNVRVDLLDEAPFPIFNAPHGQSVFHEKSIFASHQLALDERTMSYLTVTTDFDRARILAPEHLAAFKASLDGIVELSRDSGFEVAIHGKNTLVTTILARDPARFSLRYHAPMHGFVPLELPTGI